MTNQQIRIAGIGMDAASHMFVSSLLKLHSDYRGILWHYENCQTFGSDMDYMAACADKEIVLLDISGNIGRRALYTIRAVHRGALGVLSDDPEEAPGDATLITKPLRAQPLMAFFESAVTTQLGAAARA